MLHFIDISKEEAIFSRSEKMFPYLQSIWS